MTSLRNRAIKDLSTKVSNLRIEAERLENQRGLGARQAVEAVEKAKALRKQADQLERNANYVQQYINEREMELQMADRQQLQQAQDVFSTMQDELLGTETAFNEAVDSAYGAMVYNTAVNVSEGMVKRQVGKLLRGEGQTDAKGNRYVNFSEGSNAPTFRAIVTSDGNIGIITVSMGEGE